MPESPLVSCVMPTHGRRRFVRQAIRYFLRQTYTNRELVILDDGPDPVADVVPDDPRIRYEGLVGRRRSLGTKRNLACEAARGDLILHWDDDDWMADDRVALQVEALLRDGADASGLDRLLFLQPEGPTAWEYRYIGLRRPWLAGGTLCYTREAWRRHPFPDVKAGEDTRFVWSRAVRRAVALPDPSFYVALIHAGNTSPKRTRGRQWRRCPVSRVRSLLRDDWRFYARDTGIEPAELAARTRGPRGRSHAAGRPHGAATASPTRSVRVSLVLPAHASGVPLLERTLLALDGQTRGPSDFEVVVAADGGDADGVIADAVREVSRPYDCRLVEVPRPTGDLPHRNHARNAGCSAARGELLWVLDADFILPAHAIEHLLTEYDRARERGAVPVFSPCLAAIAESPERWIETTRVVTKRLDVRGLLDRAGSGRIRRDQYSGFPERHRPGGASSERWRGLLEGFPALPKTLWEALGGFDERFVGWGGNKEEFVRRLVALDAEGVVEVRLLRSVLALHQPHAADPGKTAFHQGLRRNRRRFRAVLDDLRRDAPWWRDQRDRARAAVRVVGTRARATVPAAPTAASDSRSRRPPQRLSVGILAVADPRKGLWRDAETLVWALEHAPVRRASTTRMDVSVFPVPRLQTAVEPDPRRAVAGTVKRDGSAPEAEGAVVAPGTSFARWLSGLDVLVACEVWLPRAFRLVRECRTRLVFIPNLDWAYLDGDTGKWIEAVRESGAEVWAKTEEARRILQEQGIACHAVPWSIPDPVRRDRPPPRRERLRLLLLAGMGGWGGRRGVDIALRSFALARAEDPRLELVLHSIRPVRDYAPDAPLDTPGIQRTEGLVGRAEVDRLYDEADAVLYPTRFDGFGISLLESLHAGLPVLSTDGDPMRELVEHEHNGLLVAAEPARPVRLASRWECSDRALADAVLRLGREPDLLRRLTCPEPGALVARRHAFLMRVRELLAREAAPRVVLLHSAAEAGARPSELFWGDALRQHGYHVVAHPYSVKSAARKTALQASTDLVLVGKAPTALVRELRRETTAPVVMWHHDLSDATSKRLRWFRETAPLCDLVATPDADAAGMLPEGRRPPVVQVFPGPKVDGDRGPGRRPRFTGAAGGREDVVFLGRASPERAALLRKLGDRCVLRIYGEADGWLAHGLPCQGPRWGADADAVIAGAGVVISVSARNDRHYTSNRLFHSAAAGGCLLVRAFPGVESLYPADTIETFRDADEAVARAAALLEQPDRRREMRRRAEEHTFRWHSWGDRVGHILEHVRRLQHAPAPTPPAAPALPIASNDHPPATVPERDLWENRAVRHGPRSVGHLKWSDEEFCRQTDRCWRIVAPLLRRHRADRDRRLLDFGCGAGRFSVRLEREGFHVTGADITAAFLEIARRGADQDGIGLVHVPRGARLPFTDGGFDALWTAFTLQHVPDAEFGPLIRELNRVIRTGGLVALVENTLPHSTRTSRSGHVVFRRPAEYMAAFPGIRLAARLDIEGEEHSVLIGRVGT